MPDVIAVDWSGRATGAARTIWLAHVRDGELIDLENGRDRDEVVEEIIARTRTRPATVVGLDFSFSFPRWYCEREGWTTGPAVWEAMAVRGEALLAACEPPFWGRPGSRARIKGDPLRATERAARAGSTFRIGGAGAVGTGAIRGMPWLARLAAAGLAIWPFHPPALPAVVEIYPRALTGPVVKRDAEARGRYLATRFPDIALRARAASTEDAFDAAVSALVMHAHAGHLARLPQVAPGTTAAIEGEIWRPPEGGQPGFSHRPSDRSRGTGASGARASSSRGAPAHQSPPANQASVRTSANGPARAAAP
jgi:hypothetical protein